MSHPLAQFVLFDGFDPLDVVAPYEVLSAGREFLGGELDLVFVSAEGARDVVSGTPGITLPATAAWDPGAPGYVVVPGASGPADAVPVLLGRFAASAAVPLLRRCLAEPAVTVAAVCGGSLALAMAGLLAGRTATTHVLGIGALAATGVTAVRARVVDDGDLVTAGGVTSGLDLGLYLLERDFGPRIAHAVEELFEYERRGTTWTGRGRVPAA
ncbi:DJ-1/PfpI family protein [Amycolatopsis tolypomycina]|uniref:DJ-1/PfpI family protein n=1 Tax=Amycolatopsis tolypomycina TaxID=208445 RepID=A0A1H4TIY8_9PSEU|nr:DJ-1/PfpI family protein [Amycolatopsis tolypomycina]SEC56357.1 DJ-1/PfpI family protein [Amycolatopsis tolypomycina]